MSFKDRWKRLQESAARNNPLASFGTLIVTPVYVQEPMVGRYPREGARATLETGAGESSRITATRVATGAVLAGPVGAIIGAMAKKDTTKIHVIVELADGTVLMTEGPRKQMKKAVALVNEINKGSHAAETD